MTPRVPLAPTLAMVLVALATVVGLRAQDLPLERRGLEGELLEAVAEALRGARDRDAEAARRGVERAWALAQQGGGELGWAYARLVRGVVRYRLLLAGRAGDATLGDAAADLERAESELRASGRERDAGAASLYRAHCAGMQSEPMLCERLARRAVEDLAGSPLEVEARSRHLMALVEMHDFGLAEADAAWLEAALPELRGPDLYSAAYAVGRWCRGAGPGQGSRDDLLHRAERAFTLWQDGADTDRQRASALEWRANARANLEDLAGARADLQRASDLFAVAEREGDAVRCLLQAAWIEFRAGDFARSRALLAEHRRRCERFDPVPRRQLWDELKTRAIVARAAGDDDDALAALDELIALEDRMIRGDEADYRIYSASKATVSHQQLVLLLSERAPSPEAFWRATAAVEHARARLLRWQLERETAPDETWQPGKAAPELAALPKGVVELRWFIARSVDAMAGGEEYVLLARTGDELLFENLGPRADLDRAVQGFLDRWMSTAGLARTAAAYQREATSLAGRVLGSAARWLERRELQGGRLWIMADGALERLPFGALLLGEGDADRGFAGLPYLARRLALLHVPSRAIHDALPAPAAARRVLVVLHAEARGAGALALPRGASELAALRELHPSLRALTGERATLAELRGELGRGPTGWLHLIAHAETGETAGRTAEVILRGSRLGADEVAALPLTPGVRVMLSACGTGTGEFHRGEGVLGLWRSFLLAGASCVVSTLCAVEDRASAAWMAQFHAIAAEGVPIADAIRQANLRWLRGEGVPAYPRGSAVRDPAHPFLWAGYVCVGRDRPE